MGKPEKIKTTVTLPEDLYWRFQEEKTKRRVSSNDRVMEEAIEMWLAGDRPKEVATSPYQVSGNEAEKLQAMIAAANDAIAYNLAVLEQFRRLGGAVAKADIDRRVEAITEELEANARKALEIAAGVDRGMPRGQGRKKPA